MSWQIGDAVDFRNSAWVVLDRTQEGESLPLDARHRRLTARYGLMFWFRWKRLSGSYFRLTSTSRS